MAKEIAPAPYLAWIIPYQGETTPPIPPTEPPGGGTPPPDAWWGDDGLANAPTGTPLYPTLLNSYGGQGARVKDKINGIQYQPPWNVAGVDYPVGPDSGTVFQTPQAAFAGNPHVSFSGFDVWLDAGMAGQTIKNIDFGMNEGVGNSYALKTRTGCDNLTVENCKFAIGASGHMQTSIGGVNTIFTKCKFNGNSRLDDGNNAAIMGVGRNNDFSAYYCWFKDTPGDTTDYGQNNNIKYCLYDNSGTSPTPHPDWLQMTGGVYNLVINFNTVYYRGPSSQGFGFYSQTAETYTINSAECQYNTIVTTGDQPAYIFGIGINNIPDKLGGGGGKLTGTMTVANNFIDPTGCYAGIFNSAFKGNRTPPSGTTYVEENNVDMRNGGGIH